MLPEYELAISLRGDEVFELHRGRRARTSTPVLVKLARADVARPNDNAVLRRECALAAELPSASVLLPRIVEHGQRTALVMEDPGGDLLTTIHLGARDMFGVIASVGEQIAEALGELHARGMVHGALRPEVVLCDVARPQAWLIDLSTARRNAQAAGVMGHPIATLPYVSPEQTGRIDRPIDHRSDLYALGVVLYELLCGAPPFQSDDPLELIHRHLAAQPIEPRQRDAAIPAALSAVVMRLLAKSPDERFQTAIGVAHDLRRCARDWSQHGRMDPFVLGERDAIGQLTVSSRLYGRESHVQALMAAFERACSAADETAHMVLVDGPAGTGKTALIEQLYRPIVRRRGYFISGKFDQVARGIPFGALIQAFHGLVQQLLTETEADLAQWRQTLNAALGSNGGVLAEVIPQIEFIVGPQAAPAQLGSIEAQNRFQRVLQNFLAALARPERPLVVFLDDLQWADAATLDLLEPLLMSTEERCLLLIGAYRPGEAETGSRLADTLSALEAAGVSMSRISLGHLLPQDVTALVADTLRCTAGEAEPLAQLVSRKTGANPLFATQFLKSLEREGHLRFDVNTARWTYRIDDIANAPMAADVIELMTRNIQRLPPKSQYALTLAACIGNRFDRRTLSIVSEQTTAQVERDLAAAVAEGLLVISGFAGQPVDDGAAPEDDVDAEPGYAFLHDRVQQAAYALIPQDRRRMVHLTVGRLLLSRTPQGRSDARRFDIVQHLNLGRALITSRDERLRVAALNLDAGRKAKSATAHDTALDLFLAGIDLLGEAAWDSHHTLAFNLHLEAAESRYLCGQFEEALAAFARLLGRARTPIEGARVIRLRSVQYENMARYAESIATAREGIAMFGVTFADDEAGKLRALDEEIKIIDRLRGQRAIASLKDLPLMTDPQVRMVMSMLTDIWSASYIIGDATLARLISATLVRLSLEHGNAEESAYGYVTHAITVGGLRRDYAQAHEYGRLALAVNSRLEDTRRRAKIYQQFHAHVNFWCQPFDTCAPYAREACRSGLESGDFLYAAYGAGTEPWAAMAATQDLAAFERDHEASIGLIERLKNQGFADSVRVLVNWSRALQGTTNGPLSLDDDSLDEALYVATYKDNPFFSTIHAIVRLHLCSLFGTPAEALTAARHAGSTIKHLPGTVWPVIFDFWNALALATNIDAADGEQRRTWLDTIRGTRAAFDQLSQHCAQNFRCQALLLGAEVARIENRDEVALQLYGLAIEFADAHPLVHWAALSNELCGRHLLSTGRRALGRMHLAQARACYARWGAHAKVQAMRTQYPELSARGDTAATTTPVAEGDAIEAAVAVQGEHAGGLDFFSVVKAAQAIAAETEVEGLLARLMRIAIENAGAERGALILESDSGPVVHTVNGLEPEPSGEPIPLEQASSVPIGLVSYVRRTSTCLVLAQAEIDGQHGADPYIAKHGPRSIMCVPAQHRGRQVGVLYLENCHVSGAFTVDRARILQSLSAQAAIALENARLHRELEAENSFLRRDLIANVSHDLRTPLVSIRGYLEVLASKGDALDGDQRRSYLDTAVRQSEHLGTLIDELFELAKLDFKGLSLQREAFQLGDLVSDVLQKFQLMASSKHVILELETSAGLPAVLADLSLVERVLDNLIGNALKHTLQDGRVCVQLTADPHGVQTSVIDNGVGIDPTDLPHIFDRFYRGRAASSDRTCQVRGTGLGLAIARRIVELHGRSIDVNSGPDGTTFRFALPVASAAS